MTHVHSGLDARITLSSYSTRSSRHGPPNYRGNVENFNGPISLNVSYDEGSTQFVPYEFRVSGDGPLLNGVANTSL